MAEVYFSLGSNLGNRKRSIEKAINLLKEGCKILDISLLYITEPVGYKNQGWFLNCVAKAETKLQPEELLLFTKSIEKKLKRKKSVRCGPRTIDIDILFYGNKIIKSRKFVIPHPRMHKRAFVLQPFSDINPYFVHPVLKKNIKKILAELRSRKKVKIYRK